MKIIGNDPISYLFGKTWKYSEGNRKKIVAYWLCFITANAFSLITYPLTLSELINTVQLQGITSDNFAYLCMLLAILPLTNFIFWCFHGPGRYLESMNSFRCRINKRKHLFKGVMTLPMQWHVDHHSGDTISKVGKGTQALFDFSSEAFLVIRLIVMLIVCCYMLARNSISIALIVAGTVLLTTCITMYFDKVIMAYLEILNKLENEAAAEVQDNIGNIVTVIILRVENFVYARIGKKLDEPLAVQGKYRKAIEMKWFLISMSGVVLTSMVLLSYFIEHLDSPEKLLVGSIVLLTQYLDRLENVFYDFTSIYSNIVQQYTQVQDSEKLTEEFREKSLQNHLLPKDWREITVRDLNFSYHREKSREQHLTNLSFWIRRGEKIAFVGKSGNGKSTCFSLIMALYDALSAEISVDGVTVPNGFEGICRDIALVPQAPEIFATTVRENITMGADVSEETLRHYTEMACLTDVVERMPKKFDSKINEKGVNLSVGEQQRLALARGLLVCKDKSIILLDEPTSSLDAVTEFRVYENVFRIKNTAVISSIHRFNLLPLFDYIYVFEKGRIVAHGTLLELRKRSSEFQELYKSYENAQK